MRLNWNAFEYTIQFSAQSIYLKIVIKDISTCFVSFTRERNELWKTNFLLHIFYTHKSYLEIHCKVCYVHRLKTTSQIKGVSLSDEIFLARAQYPIKQMCFCLEDLIKLRDKSSAKLAKDKTSTKRYGIRLFYRVAEWK